ncbi:pPIWI_RE_Y domain-containing protein [Ottowia oryzae]
MKLLPVALAALVTRQARQVFMGGGASSMVSGVDRLRADLSGLSDEDRRAMALVSRARLAEGLSDIGAEIHQLLAICKQPLGEWLPVAAVKDAGLNSVRLIDPEDRMPTLEAEELAVGFSGVTGLLEEQVFAAFQDALSQQPVKDANEYYSQARAFVVRNPVIQRSKMFRFYGGLPTPVWTCIDQQFYEPVPASLVAGDGATLCGHCGNIMVVSGGALRCTTAGRGTPLMKLSGDSDSVWNRLLLDLHAPAAQGRNAFIGGTSIATIMAMSGRFGQAAERLTAGIVKSPKEFRDEYSRKLLTGLSLIADMFPLSRLAAAVEDEEEVQAHLDARQGLERIWDYAAKRVAFREGGEALRHLNELQREDDGEASGDQPPAAASSGMGDSEVSKIAAQMHVTPDAVRAYAAEVLDALDTWDREGTDEYLNVLARVLLRAPGLAPAKEPKFFTEHVRLLANVTLLVLQHFGLGPHLRLLNGQGILGDEVFESRPSKELLGLVPESLAGRLSGVRYTVGDEGDVDIAHVGFVGTPRMLMHRIAQLGRDSGDTGPAVLLTSATSLLQDSPSYHINEGPHYVLRRPNAGAGWADSRYFFLPLKDPYDDRQRLFFSGSRVSRREFVLKAMATELLEGGRVSKVESALAQNDVVDGVDRKAAFVVNSYEQCEMLYDHIRQQFPAWRDRVRYLVRGGVLASASEHGITASEVERLGDDKDWDLFIFPMSAIGRGVNIVYKFGPRADKAMIGSLYFLTRPHPRSDSLGFLQGVVGAASEAFDQASFASPEEALAAMRARRSEVSLKVAALLRLPQASRALGEFGRPFVADQMIMILQTIGRAMRGDCPAFVYFVDAAWAPKSANGQPDNNRTSMLLMMRRILDDCLTHPDAALRDCYENLYRSFYAPLAAISGLKTEDD